MGDCRETAKTSIVDFDLDFDVVGALPERTGYGKCHTGILLASLKTVYVHADVQVQVQDEESRFRLKNTFRDRN